MKNTLFAIYFLLSPIFSFAQNLKIMDIWHYQKGDFNADSLIKFKQQNRLYLKYNELITIQLENKNNSSSIFHYKISDTEKYSTWRAIGSEPIIQLPLLDGGNHLLEIQQQNKVICKLPIYIEKAFWQKTWFLVALVIYIFFLLSIAIYFFFLYNLRQKLKLQDVRNRIAADLHDEVGSNLNSIAIFVELLRKKASPELMPILEKITNNSSESVALMQDTIWAIQAKNDDFQKFVEKMRNFAVGILGAKDVALQFENLVDSKKNLLTMEQRKNAYLIYKEAINNIVKHAQASKVHIKIWIEDAIIMLEIKDNGKGFDTSQHYEGNGIQNFFERAEMHEMRCSLDSEQGVGTRLLLEIFTI